MTTPREFAIVALLAGGVFFVFVGAVGIIRLPDLYTRTHAASKSDTLGVVLSLSAATLVFENVSMRLKVFALLLFMLVTTPTATHAIARAAFDQGISPWTVDDAPDNRRAAAGSDSDEVAVDADVRSDGGDSADTSIGGDTDDLPADVDRDDHRHSDGGGN